MNAARPPRSTSPPGWAEVLDSIQQFLERNIADLASRQRELSSRLPSTSADSATTAERPHRLDDGFAASLEQVAGLAADAESHLRGVQEILGAWLTDAEELRAKLAKGDAASV